MTRKAFLASLSAIPLLGAVAARLSASQPMVKVDVAPKPKAEHACIHVDFWLLLECIAEIETGNDDTKVGACGSRSRFQISEKVWRDFFAPATQGYAQHFKDMCHGDVARFVAKGHLQWLDRNIPRVSLMERYERSWCLAYGWNAGLDGYKAMQAKRGSNRSLDYATRVHAIFKSRLNSTPA